jgi:hypothetical protein
LRRDPKEGRLAMNVRRPLAVVALAVVGTVTFPGPALADASTGDDPFVVVTGELGVVASLAWLAATVWGLGALVVAARAAGRDTPASSDIGSTPPIPPPPRMALA